MISQTKKQCFIRSRRRVLAVAVFAGAMAGINAASVEAQQSSAVQAVSVGYDIPAGPLGAMLLNFAEAVGVELKIDGALTAGKRSNGLRGNYTVQQGFEQLLQGSGLVAAQNGKVYSLQVHSETARTLSAVKVVDSALGSTTERTGSYTTGATSTAARLNLSPRETPQSVSVITRQQIEDRNFVNLDDAMEFATGITASTANFNRISYTARGFALTDNMVDGLPSIANAYAGYVPNLAFYDRVEIIRGGSGLTYGGVSLVGSAGGTVNLVRKRPTAQSQVSVVLRRGSFDNNYVEVDAAAPLNEKGTVRGRVDVSYEDKETFIELEDSRKPAFYGIVESDLGAKTLLTLGGSLERYDGNFAPYGLPRYTDGGDLGLPRSSRGYAPAYNNYYTDVDTVFAEVEHQFDERWKLRVAANYQEREQGGFTINTTGAVNRTTLLGPSFGTTVSDSKSDDERRALDLIVTGGFDLLGRSHDVAFGGSWAETETGRGRSATGTAPTVTQNIFNVDPWSIPRPALGPWTQGATSSTSTTDGIYAVGRFSVADPLKVILGARVSSVTSESKNHLTGVKAKAEEKNEFTPYGGIVYDFAEHWSAYASYADIFRPQNTNYTASGSPLEPVIGANYELGVKGEFYDGKLNTSFAVFRVEETNRAQVDPEHLQPCSGSPTLGDCYVAEGEVRGEGFETEISGELLPNWQITAGYTYVDTEYLRDRIRTGGASANEGKSFRTTTPEHLFRVWSDYKLPGALAAWSVGGGVSAQSEIYSLNTTTNVRYDQSGYAIWNLRVGYKLDDHWSLALNINNLFDKEYYLRLGTVASGNRYGEPRNTMVTLRGTF